MLAVAYLDNRGDEFNAACKVLAGVMQKRDEDVQLLVKELRRPSANADLFAALAKADEDLEWEACCNHGGECCRECTDEPMVGYRLRCDTSLGMQHLHEIALTYKRFLETPSTPPAALAASGGGEPVADAELVELVKMEQRATPAPWFVHSEPQGDETGYTHTDSYLVPQPGPTDAEGNYNDIASLGDSGDGEFVAAMRNALPGLLTRLRKAESAAPASIGEVAGEKWMVPCGCDKHGDHLGCNSDCQQYGGCTHPLGQEVTTSINPDAPAPASPLVERPAGPLDIGKLLQSLDLGDEERRLMSIAGSLGRCQLRGLNTGTERAKKIVKAFFDSPGIGQADRWISAEKQMPEAVEPVLALSVIPGDARVYIARWMPHASPARWWLRDSPEQLAVVTHWQPLPTAPTDEAR